MASIEIPPVFVATKQSATLVMVCGSISAAVEDGMNRVANQMPGYFVESDGDLGELEFAIAEAQNRGRLKESARAFKVRVRVEVEELHR